MTSGPRPGLPGRASAGTATAIETIAEAFIRMFEEQPELLALIEQRLASRRATSRYVVLETDTPDLHLIERSIETTLAALSDPRYTNHISRDSFVSLLAGYERDFPSLVIQVRARFTYSRNSERSLRRVRDIRGAL